MLFTVKQSRWILAVFAMLLTSQAFAHGMSEAEKQIIIEGGNLRYIWIGATHMLSGYDHLAFVFGIIFFLTRFKEIVKYVTAFTLGHSITLIFATFNAIQVNYFLIDAIIALSVCYIAFANLDGFKKYLNVTAPNMLAMIFGLGLIHGLGLSTRLQQLPLSEDHLLMNIISFNVGIELGQITALALMLLIIAAFRKSHSFPIFSKISNYGLILAGGFLFLMQMHGYEHTANAEEYNTGSEPANNVKNSNSAQQSDWTDTIKITLPARGDTEYKLHIVKDATFHYSWKTDRNDAELFFDFHADPKGDTTGYFKSFEKSTDSQSSGSLTAIFEGSHGWYWKNNNNYPVNITLNVKGDYQRLDLKPAKPKIEPAHKSID